MNGISPKSKKIFFAAIALVIVLATAKLIVKSKRKASFLLPPRRSASLGKIEFAVGKSSFSVVKKDGEWRLERPFEYMADSGKMEDLVKIFAKASIERKLTSDPEKKELFGLDNPLTVRLYDGELFRTLIFGSGGPFPKTMFFLKDDDPSVYQCEGVSKYKLPRKAEEVMSKKIFPRADKALSVKVDFPGFNYELSRKGEIWNLNGTPLSGAEAAERLLGAVSFLEADKILPGPGFAIEKPEYTVQVVLEDGNRKTLRAKKAGNKLEAAVSGSEGFILEISEWKLNPLKKQPEDFR